MNIFIIFSVFVIIYFYGFFYNRSYYSLNIRGWCCSEDLALDFFKVIFFLTISGFLFYNYFLKETLNGMTSFLFLYILLCEMRKNFSLLNTYETDDATNMISFINLFYLNMGGLCIIGFVMFLNFFTYLYPEMIERLGMSFIFDAHLFAILIGTVCFLGKTVFHALYEIKHSGI